MNTLNFRNKMHDGETINVSVVDDDVQLCETLARWINSFDGFCCVSQHNTAEAALRELPAIHPHVVLMDINLPDISGVECTRHLKSSMPEVQIIMLTVYEDTDHIFNALAAGATGYLLKQTEPDQLIAAIRDVYTGGAPMTSHIARKVVVAFRKNTDQSLAQFSLSPREQEVLDLLVKGYLYKEIADALKISFDTVRTHVRRIYEKLHVRSRTEAVAKRLGRPGPVPPIKPTQPPSGALGQG